MAATPRRVGTETSKTRENILDCVETLMAEEGYPSVTYRALAAKAGVTPSLVQYYFPTLDSIFLVAIRRRTDENLQRLTDALQARPDEPLHVLWDFSWEEATGALVTEFLALGNHRKTIGEEIARVTEQIRGIQRDALAAHFAATGAIDRKPSAGALVTLIAGIPKLLTLEKGVGITTDHADVVDALEAYVDSVEQRKTPRTQRRKKRK
ncbi:TetR/AcrR family transcriptional regulator [Gordonia sp. DT218]|uniref:TetR/AcrR family transcriptional regulator n=1 Tax=unclassified Gordonia (in: high G+C Gram-positive bacteria) TaxID=2657482 RepID=UPI003CE7822B